MKSLFTILAVAFSLNAYCQIDTSHYLAKPVSPSTRTDTTATNLLTYNQTTHQAELMSGTTLKTYFRNGLAQASTLVKYYNHTGIIATPTRQWNDIVTVTGATQTIDISTAGFTSINSIVITGRNNTSTIGSFPIPFIKTSSATSLVVNILVNSTTTVSILGANVLGLIFPTSFTGMNLDVHVDGW